MFCRHSFRIVQSIHEHDTCAMSMHRAVWKVAPALAAGETCTLWLTLWPALTHAWGTSQEVLSAINLRCYQQGRQRAAASAHSALRANERFVPLLRQHRHPEAQRARQRDMPGARGHRGGRQAAGRRAQRDHRPRRRRRRASQVPDIGIAFPMSLFS